MESPANPGRFKGSPSAVPCRHYGWNVPESPGKLGTHGAPRHGPIESLEPDCTLADSGVAVPGYPLTGGF